MTIFIKTLLKSSGHVFWVLIWKSLADSLDLPGLPPVFRLSGVENWDYEDGRSSRLRKRPKAVGFEIIHFGITWGQKPLRRSMMVLENRYFCQISCRSTYTMS